MGCNDHGWRCSESAALSACRNKSLLINVTSVPSMNLCTVPNNDAPWPNGGRSLKSGTKFMLKC